MATSVAIVTFNSLPAVNDSVNLKAHLKTAPYTEYSNTEQFKSARVNPGETTIGSDTNNQAQLYASALADDYNDPTPRFGITVNGNKVIVKCLVEGMFDYFNSYEVTGSAITVELIDTQINVSGLDSDRYLINNDIIVELYAPEVPPYFEVVFQNLTNQKTSNPIRLYPNFVGVSRFNASPILKSIFTYPSDASGYAIDGQTVPNLNQFKITVSAGELADVQITKDFIRGGKRTSKTNQVLSVGDILRPTALLPIWPNYPTAEYLLSEENTIVKKLISEVPLERRDIRRIKGCNNVYVKYANQSGGYCHWMFESHSDTESTNGLGAYVRDNNIEDLGVESESKTKLYSKVPEYYKGYVNDLIASPEIYIYRDNEFIRLINPKNSFTWDNIKRSYAVTINLEYDFRFNPSLLWSN